MKKHHLNNLLKNLMYVAFGLVLAIGVSYIAAASSYTDNTNPPTNNTPTPLNVGTGDQIKPSPFCTAGNCGGLSLGGTFIANQNAAFNALLYINGLMRGGTLNADGSITDGTLAFGNSTTPASVQVNGSMTTSGAMQGDTLKNSNGDNGICSDENGDIGLCNIDICSNLPGLQLAAPSGYTANADGTCTPTPKEFLSILNPNPALNYNNFGGYVVNDGYLTFNPKTAITIPSGVAGYDYAPYIDQVSLGNDDPNSWRLNEVPGVQGTTLAGSSNSVATQVLLNVVEAGSYKFNINYSGQIGTKGKSGENSQCVQANFYLKINNKYIEMGTPTNATSAQNSGFVRFHEGYPASVNTSTPTYPDAIVCGSGDSFTYAPYNINFKNTYNLNPGDQVSLYIDLYGDSIKTGFFYTNFDFSAGAYKDFSWSVSADNGSSIDIVETPSE